MSPRLRRAKPASRSRSRATIFGSALIALILLTGLTYVALIAPRGIPGLNYYYLSAQFADAGNIQRLAEVRIAGRRVGQVTDTSWQGGHGVVKMQFSPGVGPLPATTTARIRLKGLLGARFVDVSPGAQGPDLPDNSTLPRAQTSTAVGINDVLQAFDARRRRQIQKAVQTLGTGFAGRGQDLNAAIHTAPSFISQVQSTSDAILARKGAAARLAPSVESTAAAFDPVRNVIAAGLPPAARVMETFAEHRSDLEMTVALAPEALSSLRGGLDAATPLLNEAAGLARAATRLTGPAPAALNQTAALLRASPEPLQRTEPLLDAVDGAIPDTLTFLERTAVVSPPGARALGNTIPLMRAIGDRPCELLEFARNWRSALGWGVPPGFGDPIGDLDKQNGLGPLNSFRTLAVLPTRTEALLADGPALPDGHKQDAYPGPCEASGQRTP